MSLSPAIEEIAVVSERHMTVHVGHPVGRGQSHRVTYTSRHPENRTDTYRTPRDRTNFPLSAHNFRLSGEPDHPREIASARARAWEPAPARSADDPRCRARPTVPEWPTRRPQRSPRGIARSRRPRSLHLDHTAPPGGRRSGRVPRRARPDPRADSVEADDRASSSAHSTAPQSPRAATPTTLAWQQQVEQTGTEISCPPWPNHEPEHRHASERRHSPEHRDVSQAEPESPSVRSARSPHASGDPRRGRCCSVGTPHARRRRTRWSATHPRR